MSEIMKFEFEGHKIEAMPGGKDEPDLFDAVLIAKALGFANPHEAIREHVDKEDLAIRSVLTGGGKQKKKFLKEAGLWSLVLRSNTPAAKRFQRFVSSEVLPSIRRFGRYDPGLEVKLAAYLGEHVAKWAQMFPPEFWQGLDRLYGVKRSDPSERPLFYAQCVMLVYQTMDPEVYAAMKLRVTPDQQKNGVKQHQALSTFGREQTMRHVMRCVGHMDACTSGPEWRKLIADVFGKQQRLPLKGAHRKEAAA